MSEKMADAIMDEVIEHVTLDKFLNRHPKTLKWPEDYVQMVKLEREKRAMFITAQQEKKDKKEIEE